MAALFQRVLLGFGLYCLGFGLAVADEPPAEDADPCRTYNQENSAWWDATHSQVSRFVCWPSRWLDQFFIDDDDIEWRDAGTTLKVTQSFTYRDNHDNNNGTKVSASLRVPGLKKHLKLVVERDKDDGDRRDNDVDDESTGVRDSDRDQSGTQAALRWVAHQSKRVNLHWDLGVRSGIHPYTGVRYRWRKEMPSNSRLQITDRLRYIQSRGWSNDFTPEFSLGTSSRSSLLFSSGFYISEQNNKDDVGWVVTPRIGYYYRLSERSALRYQVGVDYNSKPDWRPTLYHTSLRYRRNIFRPWLFYELEPFKEWLEDEDFHGVNGITFRLQMLLGYFK